MRRPVAPMLAAPVDVVPEGADLVHEPKWDGWRCIAFREGGGVYLQSRAGRNLTTYFPDITRAIRAAVPPGVVLDGELIVWESGRTNFAQLQRRVTAGRDLLRLAREYPAHYVLFDLLADSDGDVIVDLPLAQRRGRLERLLVDAPAQLTVTPQTADMREVSDWLVQWTAAVGNEGCGEQAAGRPVRAGPARLVS
ncbi:ATP-dependent DNA ligase [Micromonospora chalcea]